MNFFSKLTTLGRVMVIAVIVAVVGVVAYSVSKNVDGDVKLPSLSSIGGSKYDAVLLVDTYTGWSPIVWGNGFLSRCRCNCSNKEYQDCC